MARNGMVCRGGGWCGAACRVAGLGLWVRIPLCVGRWCRVTFGPTHTIPRMSEQSSGGGVHSGIDLRMSGLSWRQRCPLESGAGRERPTHG